MGTRTTADTYGRSGWEQGETTYSGPCPDSGTLDFDDLDTIHPDLLAIGSAEWETTDSHPSDGAYAKWVSCTAALVDADGNTVRMATLDDLKLPDAGDLASKAWAESNDLYE